MNNGSNKTKCSLILIDKAKHSSDEAKHILFSFSLKKDGKEEKKQEYVSRVFLGMRI
jgi:hypothetical protein